MTDSDRLDRYFTEQVVGDMLLVTMGPRLHRPTAPPFGAVLDLATSTTELYGLAAHSLCAPEPLQPLLGRPFSLPALIRARRRLAVLGWCAAIAALLAAWTALLWYALPWLQR